MSSEQPITGKNLNEYLKELAKEFRKLNGSKMSAEVILIGGAAVLANYGFREMTYDIDAIINVHNAQNPYPTNSPDTGFCRNAAK